MLTVIDNLRKCFSVDGKRMQLVQVQAATGDTSGTVQPSGMTRIEHCIMPGGFKHTAAPTRIM